MSTVREAVDQVLQTQIASGRPLAIVLAGHNGSGKSTMWRKLLAPALKMPLINADRMMLSILPEPANGRLPGWAAALRDENQDWMRVAQKGVEAFVAQAMGHGVPFAMETVFSHWRDLGDGRIESKIDRIREMQDAGYFVLLIFVGLSDAQLSIGRVLTRATEGGHNVEVQKLVDRFPRTQQAIAAAAAVADAAVLTDNSREPAQAFTVCRIQIGEEEIFDIRADDEGEPPSSIRAWLEIVSPRP